MKRLVVTLAFASLLAGATFGSVSVADAHQSGCHRWHSCPSDTGSYICGDLGYACRYPTFPSPGGTGGGASQYITRSEFRRWARQSIRDHFGDTPSGLWMEGCRRLYSAKMRCRVHWRDNGYWSSRLTITEYRTTYTFTFRR